jgi:hypothetical protein
MAQDGEATGPVRNTFYDSLQSGQTSPTTRASIALVIMSRRDRFPNEWTACGCGVFMRERGRARILLGQYADGLELHQMRRSAACRTLLLYSFR